MKNLVFMLLCAVLLSGCATLPGRSSAPPLRVGVSPSYPPVMFKQNEGVVGLEADLARMLATELGRPLEFVEVEWTDLIQALVEGRVDVIMSGLSDTPARRARIRFCDPYLRSGVTAMFPVGDRDKYRNDPGLVLQAGRIAVVPRTTGDVFVQRECPDSARVALNKVTDAPYLFAGKRMDVFMHDIWSVAWLVSENEGSLDAIWSPWTQEYLAWAVQPTDNELRGAVNLALQTWKKDGRLKAVLDRWIPFRDKIDWKNHPAP